MRARVIKIGNSQGVRIPKPILEQTGIMEDVEINIEKNQIIIRPVEDLREPESVTAGVLFGAHFTVNRL